jgi:hypothetical protein
MRQWINEQKQAINDKVEEEVKAKNPDMAEQDKEEIIEQTI